MEEIWKDVPSMYGIQASSEGRIRNKRSICRQRYSRDGYLRVSIFGKEYDSHRLVCMAFHGYETGLDTNHKDKLRDNNKAENLEWITRSENIKHAHRTELGEGNDNKGQSISIYFNRNN